MKTWIPEWHHQPQSIQAGRSYCSRCRRLAEQRQQHQFCDHKMCQVMSGFFFCCVKLVLLQCILLEILVLFIRNTHYAWQQLLILKPNSRPASSPSCPALAETLCYSGPGMGSSHFVAYSSCYCSLSALWDSCLDPLRHVTLDMTLSSSLTAGSRATSCIPVSFPLPALSALCSSPSISICPCVYAACFQKLCPQKRL